MIAVIFEVHPAAGQTATYLDHATRLRTALEGHAGFISVERFRSLADPDKILSLPFFTDEAAVAAWRNRPAHRRTQEAGRTEIFADYRLRIAPVSRDYGMHDRAEAPDDSNDHHT